MGTSVTGNGLGAVHTQKGSEHMSLGVGHLVGPRVVAAGSGTLSGGTLVVNIPLLDAAYSYIAMTNDITANNASNGVLTTAGGNTVLTLTGTSTDVIQWMIVKTGKSGGQSIGS